MYRFERVANCRDFVGNSTLWDSLAGNSPLRQSAWLGTLWEHFGDDSRAFFVVARDECGHVRGLLPLYLSGKQSSVLRFVGDGLACSDGLSVLCAPADAESIGCEMGSWLAMNSANGVDRWNLLDLDGVVAGDAAMIALVKGLSQAGAAVHAESRMHTWFKPTTDSWDEYLVKLSKPRRRSTRRLSERIAETPGLSRGVSVSETDLRADLEAMIELHQSRWNEAGQPGSFADQKFRDCIHVSASRFLRRGGLRMQTLRLNDEVIAGELQMIGGDGSITVYSTGVNMQHADLEPGRIMSIETIRHAYKNALPGIDYLRGDEPYKAQLGAEPRRIARLRVVPPTAWAKINHVAWKSAFQLRQWARRGTGSNPIVVLPNLLHDNIHQST